MIEKREWRRASVDLEADCSVLVQQETFRVRIMDINENGLCFKAPMAIKPGRKVRIDAELPGEGKVGFDLKVVWSGYFEKTGDYRAGAKIIGMEANDNEKYLRFYNARLLTASSGA